MIQLLVAKIGMQPSETGISVTTAGSLSNLPKIVSPYSNSAMLGLLVAIIRGYTAICPSHRFLCLNTVVSIQVVHWSRLKKQVCPSNGQVSARACWA